MGTSKEIRWYTIANLGVWLNSGGKKVVRILDKKIFVENQRETTSGRVTEKVSDVEMPGQRRVF